MRGANESRERDASDSKRAQTMTLAVRGRSEPLKSHGFHAGLHRCSILQEAHQEEGEIGLRFGFTGVRKCVSLVGCLCGRLVLADLFPPMCGF